MSSEVPARGWRHILLRVYRGVSEDRILANSAAVTFYALLALFPGLAAVVSIYGLFADPVTIRGHLNSLAGILPEGAIDVIREQLTRLAAEGETALGLGFLVGLAVSLWSASSGIRALFDALNVVYEEREERGFITRALLGLAFTIGLACFSLVAFAGVVAVPVLLAALPNPVGWMVGLVRWTLLLVLVAVALAVIFRYGPCRRRPRWRWITWGGALAAPAWLLVSALFSWYATNFGNFNRTYGSLGAVVGFMTWIWISVIVILIGAKLNAAIEGQAAREGGVARDLARRAGKAPRDPPDSMSTPA